MARPQFGTRPASLVRSARDVLVLLDLSRSMNATDEMPLRSTPGRPSRLAVAKEALLEALAGSPGDRVGLVVFGGSAFLQLPLTADQAAFRRFLDAATTDDLANPATDLSRALSAAATAFEHEGERGFQSVLLVSDGESAEGDVGAPLKRLRLREVPVFAIGVGTVEGAPVPADSSEAPEKWHRDHIGRVVQPRLEEGDLQRAASETNGTYLRWTPGAGARMSAEMARLEKRTMSARTSPEQADRFQRAGDGDGLLQPHQFGQHFGAAHHSACCSRAAFSSGLSRLIADETTTTRRLAEICGVMADRDRHAMRAQALDVGALGDIRSLHA